MATQNNSPAEAFGFRDHDGSVHMARTMMLSELSALLDSVGGEDTEQNSYVRAIEEENCLGKRSHTTRVLTRRHLVQLYGLSPQITLFRALVFFWRRDPESRPLLALQCAYARDPLLRVSFPAIRKTNHRHVFARIELENLLDKTYPGRFSKATLVSTTRNITATWTQSGHLSGRVTKVRTHPVVTAGAAAFALVAGYLRGARGESLFHGDYAELIDCDYHRMIELAEAASSRGWIVLKRIGRVVEVQFPRLLTAEEMELVHGQA